MGGGKRRIEGKTCRVYSGEIGMSTVVEAKGGTDFKKGMVNIIECF